MSAAAKPKAGRQRMAQSTLSVFWASVAQVSKAENGHRDLVKPATLIGADIERLEQTGCDS
jgi:hypothetical protein